jgi:hypothetical protein
VLLQYNARHPVRRASSRRSAVREPSLERGAAAGDVPS